MCHHAEHISTCFLKSFIRGRYLTDLKKPSPYNLSLSSCWLGLMSFYQIVPKKTVTEIFVEQTKQGECNYVQLYLTKLAIDPCYSTIPENNTSWRAATIQLIQGSSHKMLYITPYYKSAPAEMSCLLF